MHIAKSLIAVAAVAATSVSCGNVVRQGRSPVYLVIDSLQAAPGNKPSAFATNLVSDVQTRITSPAPCTPASPCYTVYNDIGQVTLRASLKNLGSPTSPSQATTNNDVTITRIHVLFKRSDGRNTQGVDVPREFDTAATGTIGANGILTLSFDLVPISAKEDHPLVDLVSNPVPIKTIAYVTFYGTDQAGNDLSVTGLIDVTFDNFLETS